MLLIQLSPGRAVLAGGTVGCLVGFVILLHAQKVVYICTQIIIGPLSYSTLCPTLPRQKESIILSRDTIVISLHYHESVYQIAGCIVVYFLPVTILYHLSGHRCSDGRPS